MSVLWIGYAEVRRTSQLSRIEQRAPATDLRGPKASAESLTARRSNLAEDEAVDFQSGLFSFTPALDPTFSFSALDSSPSGSRPSPVVTRGSGRGSELDEFTPSPHLPTPGSFALCLLLPNRRLIPFLNLENEPRRSSILVVDRRRGWSR